MTYDEYFNAVADRLEVLLAKQIGIHNRNDVIEYMKSEEVCIKNDFNLHIKEYKSGKFPSGVWEGCVVSTAYCLYMMY